MAGEKTLPATPRRREQARRDGDVLQLREVPAALAVLAGWGVATTLGAAWWHSLAGWVALRLDTAADGETELPALLAGLPLLPLLVLAALVGVAALAGSAAAGSIAPGALRPKFDRLSPAQGARRIFSATGLAGALLAILKAGAVGGVGVAVIVALRPVLAAADVSDLAALGRACLRLLAAAGLVLAVLAVLDAGWSWWRRERKLRMSLEEVRRESRENDGAPELKAALRRAQMAMATRRMQASLAEASVVVVNPTHFAVALRYRGGVDAAPVVVEKGRADIALALIETARKVGVPVVRTPRLARALFFTARRGDMVREELFTAVATVLAFVMRYDPDAAAPPVFVPPTFDFDADGQRRKPGTPVP